MATQPTLQYGCCLTIKSLIIKLGSCVSISNTSARLWLDPFVALTPQVPHNLTLFHNIVGTWSKPLDDMETSSSRYSGYTYNNGCEGRVPGYRSWPLCWDGASLQRPSSRFRTLSTNMWKWNHKYQLMEQTRITVALGDNFCSHKNDFFKEWSPGCPGSAGCPI